MSPAKNKNTQDIEDSYEQENYTDEELTKDYEQEPDPNEDIMYKTNEEMSNTDQINDNSELKVLLPSIILRELELLWRGYVKKGETYYQTGNAYATSETINLLIGGLKSIMNETNMASYKKPEEIETIMLEKCKEIIVTVCDDPTVLERPISIEAIGNQCEHALELFLSFTLLGHGSQLIEKLRARVYDPKTSQSNNLNRSFLETMKQKFGGNN